MRPDVIDRVVSHYRALLGEALDGIVLYGSRARGDAREDSDLDLFLVAEGLASDRFERARQLSPPLLGAEDPSVSVRALTPQEFDLDISPLDLDIATDGKILYERGNEMSRRLAIIRQRIEEAGLYRDDDLVWRWRKEPKRARWAIRWDGVET